MDENVKKFLRGAQAEIPEENGIDSLCILLTTAGPLPRVTNHNTNPGYSLCCR